MKSINNYKHHFFFIHSFILFFEINNIKLTVTKIIIIFKKKIRRIENNIFICINYRSAFLFQ